MRKPKKEGRLRDGDSEINMFFERKPHSKGDAFFMVRMERDVSSVTFHDLFHNAQAKTGTSFFR